MLDAPQTALMDSGGRSASHLVLTVRTEAPATSRPVCVTANEASWEITAKIVSFKTHFKHGFVALKRQF